MYKESMYGLASSLIIQRLTWIAQQRYVRQVEYYLIFSPIEIQQLLHDIIKILLYEYVKEIGFELDVEANP